MELTVTDDDYAQSSYSPTSDIYVVEVTIDDCDSSMACGSSTPADIDYTIEPGDASFRRLVRLIVKNAGGSTVRTVTLDDDFGSQSTTWDGKNDSAQWVDPGDYTVIIEAELGYSGKKVSDSATITVFNIAITEPDSPACVDCGDWLQLDSAPSDGEGGSYTWSKFSGPGNVTFSDPHRKDPNFSTDEQGDYTLRLDYARDGTVFTTESQTITAMDVTWPIAHIYPSFHDELSPKVVTVGTQVTFTGTESVAGTGEIEYYCWDFGDVDGEPWEVTDPGPRDYTFSTPGGPYKIILHVKDSADRWSDQYTETDGGNEPLAEAICWVKVVPANVDVGNILIQRVNGTWNDVTGDTISVLRGDYNIFKALPNPSGASWPPSQPVWSGASSAIGPLILVTYPTYGTSTLTAKCNAGEPDLGKTVTINVTDQVVGIDIESVPQFLFGSAQYATPIKFKVVGFGSHVYVGNLRAELYLDDVLRQTVWLDERFAAGDGEGAVDNGSTDTYTCFISHSAYEGVLIEDANRTDNVYFVLKADCRNDPAVPSDPVYSVSTDLQARPALFADEYICTVEPGLIPGMWGAKITKSFNDPDQVPFQIDDPEADYQHCVNPSYAYSVPYLTCGSEPLPHPCVDEEGDIRYPIAYTERAQVAENITSSEEVCGKRLYTRLRSFLGSMNYDDNVFKNRIYGFRRGAYCCPSYGPREVTVLTSEYAMDFTKNSGNVDWHLFPTGHKLLDCTCEADAGFNAGGAASLCAIGAGLSAGAAALYPVGTVWAIGAMFGTASGTFWVIDVADLDTSIEDRAEAVLHVRYARAVWGTAGPPQEYEADTFGDVFNTTPYDHPNRNQAIDVKKEVDYVVGDTLRFFIQMNCVCSAKVRVSLLEGDIDARAEVGFWCDGGSDGDDGVLTPEDDWNTWWIRARHDD